MSLRNIFQIFQKFVSLQSLRILLRHELPHRNTWTNAYKCKFKLNLQLKYLISKLCKHTDENDIHALGIFLCIFFLMAY